MSGLWSFRQPAATAGITTTTTTGRFGDSGCDGRPMRRLVTVLLPTGVEHESSLLHSAGVGPWTVTTDVVVAQSLEQPSRTNSRARDLAAAAARSSSQLDATGASQTTDVWVSGAVAADRVDRDEAIYEVQRSWWRSLDVNTQPAIFLPSAAQRNAEPTTAGATKKLWDEEAVETAQQLLARASDAATAAQQRGGLVAVAPHSGPQRQHARAVRNGGQPKGDVSELSGGTGGGGRGRGFSLHTTTTNTRETSRQEAVTCAPVGQRNVNSRSESSHQRRTSVAPVLKANDATLCSASVGSEGSAITPTLAASEFLQRALCSAAAEGGAVEMTDVTAEEMRHIAQPHVPLLLLRFFALWRAFAEERRLLRCTAAYRRYLLECVREVLGETSLA